MSYNLFLITCQSGLHWILCIPCWICELRPQIPRFYVKKLLHGWDFSLRKCHRSRSSIILKFSVLYWQWERLHISELFSRRTIIITFTVLPILNWYVQGTFYATWAILQTFGRVILVYGLTCCSVQAYRFLYYM